MPDFTPRADRQSKQIKMLYLGHTGAGKTGSLCSLAAAGYNVRVLDLDGGDDEFGGCAIMEDYLTNPASPYLRPQAGLWDAEQCKTILSRMHVVSVAEQYNLLGVKAIPRGTAWPRLSGQLNNWQDGDDKPGNIAKWPADDVLVIDGLSQLCKAAMNFHLTLNGRADKGPRVGQSDSNDYTSAYKYILDFLDLLKSPDIKCHVIMICHIRFLVEQQSDMQSKEAQRERRGFPQTIGPMISPMIGQYFNHSLRAKSIGDGPATQRFIVTNNDDSIDLKNTAPLRVKNQYKLSTGLAEYFRDVRGQAS